MSTVTPFSGTIPSHGQSVNDFNANVENFLAYMATFAPQINQAIAEVLVGADVTLWVAGTTYYPPTIVAGSDGLRYSLTAGAGVIADNPVGSVTGRWVKIALDASTIKQVPVGAVCSFLAPTPPSGWLECDGSAVSRTAYSALFAAMAPYCGIGDGSTTFNLPDYRGRFLRGWDHQAGVDPDVAGRTSNGSGWLGSAPGTLQADQLKAHSHAIAGHAYYAATGSTWALSEAGTGQATASTGGSETRPVNAAVLFCIKY